MVHCVDALTFSRVVWFVDGDGGRDVQYCKQRGSTGPAEHLLRTTPPPPNMAAANFVFITNLEGCALNGTAVAAVLIDQ